MANKHLGSIRVCEGTRVRVCNLDCSIVFYRARVIEGLHYPLVADGLERIDIEEASRRFGFCAACGADLRVPLPAPLSVTRGRDGLEAFLLRIGGKPLGRLGATISDLRRTVAGTAEAAR